MLDDEDIDLYNRLLSIHRRNLRYLLQKAAVFGGENNVPLPDFNAIRDLREQIRYVKNVLRNAGFSVEDFPYESLTDHQVSDVKSLSVGMVVEDRVRESSSPTSKIFPSPLLVGLDDKKYRYVSSYWRVTVSLFMFLLGLTVIISLLSSPSDNIFCFVVFGVGSIGCSIYLFWDSLQKDKTYVHISSTELIYQDVNDKTVLPWNEIECVKVELGLDNKLVSFTCLGSNKTLVIPKNIVDFDQLYVIVQQIVMARLISQAIDVYNSGRALIFGNIGLDQYGVIINGKKVSWNLVKGVDINEGKIYLYEYEKSEKQVIASISTISNFFVFTELVNRVIVHRSLRK